MPGESVHYAYNNCLSLNRHTTATEYEEIVNFCKAVGFFYAVKAEDTTTVDLTFPDFDDAYALGKVHIHFATVREFATHSHTTDDKRYGAIRKSHYRADFIRRCPEVAKSLADSQYAQKFGFMTAQMTTDHALVYFSKETHLECVKLPPDIVVLRPYISLKTKRQPNIERDSHVDVYKASGRPMPPTFEDVWAYFNHRWFVLNDLKTPAMATVRENNAEAVFTALAPQGFPVPKRHRSAGSDIPSSSNEANLTWQLCKVCNVARLTEMQVHHSVPCGKCSGLLP